MKLLGFVQTVLPSSSIFKRQCLSYASYFLQLFCRYRKSVRKVQENHSHLIPHFALYPIHKIVQEARATVIFLLTFLSVAIHTLLVFVSCPRISTVQKWEICGNHSTGIWYISNVTAQSCIHWWNNKRLTWFLFHLNTILLVWHQYAQYGLLFYSSSDLLLEVLLLDVFQEERRTVILKAVFSPFCKAIFGCCTTLHYLDCAFCLLFLISY